MRRQSELGWVSAPDHPLDDERDAEISGRQLLNISDDLLSDYTELCARIFDAPIAHVGLVTHEVNWIRSAVGLDAEKCGREISFCGHALHEPDMLVVPDTSADLRFAGNPFVVDEPFIGFYAGAVLRTGDSVPIGTLCVMDHKPRDFGPREREMLGRIRNLLEREVIRQSDRIRDREVSVRDTNTDPLTGLPSFGKVQQWLDEATAESLEAPSPLGLMLVGLDRRQDFIRAHGRDQWNGVVADAARRIMDAVPAGCRVGCWTQDRFAVLSSELRSLEYFNGVASRITQAMGDGLSSGGRTFKMVVKMSGARYPDDGDSVSRLRDSVEEGFLQVDGVTGNFAFADPDITKLIAREFDLEQRLHQALDQNALEMMYQPKIELSSGRTVGAEALMRWRDTEVGWVSPAEFIPLAERSGLINSMGVQALEIACAEAASWQNRFPRPPTVAVNVSALELEDSGYPAKVALALQRWKLPPESLTLEITESALLKNPTAARENIIEVAATGVRFALDDFGTGYASFEYMRRLPIHSLKIDKTFVEGITDDQNAARICQAIIAMGKALGLLVVAEGVETEAQALFLKAYGCDKVQGYHYSKPLTAEEFAKFYDASLAGADR